MPATVFRASFDMLAVGDIGDCAMYWIRALLWMLMFFGLSACAGYKGGWASLAYLGDIPPSAAQPLSLYEVNNTGALELPGLRLDVEIDNRLRTYDTQVYFFVVPLSVDPRDVYTNPPTAGRTRVLVGVTPQQTGFMLHPDAAVLRIGNEQARSDKASEFGRWNEQGQRVQDGSRWEHRSIDAAMLLTRVGERYYFTLEFPLTTPSPESNDIALDLSAALIHPDGSPLPLIRFAPVRWKTGYT